MNNLLNPKRKNPIAGFIVIDTTNGDDAPTKLGGSGLFSRSCSPSFFRISTASYKRTRTRLDKIIARHYRIVGQLRASSMTRQWAASKRNLTLKIKSISHEILSS